MLNSLTTSRPSHPRKSSRAPPSTRRGERIRSPLSVYLSGEGTMTHIINDQGNWTSSKGGGGDAQYYCGGM